MFLTDEYLKTSVRKFYNIPLNSGGNTQPTNLRKFTTVIMLNKTFVSPDIREKLLSLNLGQPL